MSEMAPEPAVPPLGKLAAALALFQAEMPTVAKSKTADAGSYTYTYAGLAEMSSAAMPLLSAQGLAFTCRPRRTESGHYEVVGYLMHESGEHIDGALPISGGNAQALGSSISYMRRYLFGCMTGVITDDDDDGALASAAPPKKRAAAKRAERVTTTPPDDPWLDTPPRPPGSRQVTKKQLGMIGALMSELGITQRDSALLYVKDVIGREVQSRNDLTTAEAGKVIDALERDKAQPFPNPAPTEEPS